MKKNWKLLGVIAAVAIVGAIFSNINDWKYNVVDYGKESTQIVIPETDNLYVMLADEYLDDDDLSELYREKDIFTRLSNMNDDLNKYFDYYELSFQALQSLEYYDLDDDFIKVYNRKGDKIENQSVRIDGKRHYVTSLNTVQVNKKFFDSYLASMEKGDKFIDDDYILSMTENIPVLLGYNYMPYYNIGDTLKLNYLGSDMTFYIKGFLSKNLGFKMDNKNIIMDNYICVPSFKIKMASQQTDSEQDTLFKMRYYLQKNGGFIQYKADDDVKQIKQEINDLANKYDLAYTVLNTTYNIRPN
ncbi:hypothetical protein [Enterocloster clostridioformis]|uniref:hypothetical protein n=3 Tax=Enterocloster clostridioformis TaxID=1531 RepID=UPI0026762C18|nr:hypothetical protein [Enterocloster clostridioformis]